MKKSLLLILLTGVFFPSVAQLDNRVFFDQVEVSPEDTGRLILDIRALGFNKDNEYFGTIVDGYTLYGFQFSPTLSYSFASNWRIDAGAWLQKDFGNNRFSSVLPVFAIKHQKGSLTTIFGNLEGSLNHRLIEPLYDFERVFRADRLEHGGQIRIDRPGFFLDAWLNWQLMQYLNDPRQEELTGGLSLDRRLGSLGAWEVSLPFQLVAKHIGGQIDINPDPLVTVFNSAVGLDLRRRTPGRFREVRFNPYLLGYRDASFVKRQIFEDGSGLYLNLNLKTRKGIDWMISYWRGHEFQTIEGGRVYPSVGVLDPSLIRPYREVLMLRLLYAHRINDSFSVAARLEPHYDFRFGGFQYAFGIYMHFHDRFLLTHPRRYP